MWLDFCHGIYKDDQTRKKERIADLLLAKGSIIYHTMVKWEERPIKFSVINSGGKK